MPYLSAAIRSVLASQSDNFELLVSDDSSSDGSFEFLSSINDPRLQVRAAPGEMSMSEHWDWLASLAVGEWQMFIGQDDGLQIGWFELASALVDSANALELRAVVCRRAYFFWPGSEPYFGGQRLRYVASETVSVRNIRKDLRASLNGIADYFDLPQMYTTSFFRKDLVKDIRLKFGGRLILGHPQDAYLVAACSRIEECYLRSERPFSWVGSSTSSAGLAISSEGTNSSGSLVELGSSYRERVEKSNLPPSSHMGDFRLGLAGVYLWAAVRSLLELDGALEEIEELPQRTTAALASLVRERYRFHSPARNSRIRALIPGGKLSLIGVVLQGVGLTLTIIAGRSLRRLFFLYGAFRSSSLSRLNLYVKRISSKNSSTMTLEMASLEVKRLHETR